MDPSLWSQAPVQPDPCPCNSCAHDRDDPRCAAEDPALTPGYRLGRGRLEPLQGGVIGKRCPRWQQHE